jgi:hypothetical protein
MKARVGPVSCDLTARASVRIRGGAWVSPAVTGFAGCGTSACATAGCVRLVVDSERRMPVDQHALGLRLGAILELEVTDLARQARDKALDWKRFFELVRAVREFSQWMNNAGADADPLPSPPGWPDGEARDTLAEKVLAAGSAPNSTA